MKKELLKMVEVNETSKIAEANDVVVRILSLLFEVPSDGIRLDWDECRCGTSRVI